MNKTNEIIVSDVLKGLGISPALKGYHYSRYAICLILQNGDSDTFTKLCNHVADEFNSTHSKVERCIRTAVDKMMLDGNNDSIIKIFGSCAAVNGGRLTNSQFIYGIVDYVRTYLSV